MRWFVLLCLGMSALAAAENALPPRLRIRFDDDWSFRRDAITKSRQDGLKWTTKTEEYATKRIPDDFESGPWRAAKEGEDVFAGKTGFAWLRTDLGRGAKPGTLRLHFEAVDDNAAVLFNGQLIGAHEGWSDEFEFPIGILWNPAGPNKLVVLVQNTGGPGGVMGRVTLEVPQIERQPAEASPKFNDRLWRNVQLPHDYVVEGSFTPEADTSHGSLPVAPAWYRKRFVLPASYAGKSVWMDFDGVYRNATVYLNGHKLGTWPSGYMGFRHSLNKWAIFGGSNVIAVRVDPTKAEGWWYEGGGIYRHVWLNVAEPVHVRPWGTFVKTDLTSLVDAKVAIQTNVDNTANTTATCVVSSRVLDPAGKQVAISETKTMVPGYGHQQLNQSVRLMNPKLWSIETPRLYSLVTSVKRDGVLIDRVVTQFGVRSFRFDSKTGFFLNGKPVKLKGTCNHQDHAGVGIAMPDSLLEWRIKRLKEMGSNAYRCSHNPPAPELLDVCDRLGMVVMDETRHLGDTQSPKSPSGTGVSDLSELRGMILRDRNHPSVIMWSLFNEEGLQGTEEGAAIFTAMRDAVRSLDPTRPCTGAMNGGWGEGITLAEDLLGFNYGIGNYDRLHRFFPNIPMYGSETASTVSTRGIYANDAVRGYVSAYDLNKPGWGATAQESWSAIATRPWMAGEFVWTGFDYKGEPTPYGWPCINSHFGIMDICGFPKDNFFYYQAWWGNKPIVHILPHWNWAGKEGQPIQVWVYSNVQSVELFANGKSLGTKTMPAYGHLEWTVPYHPGWLVARAVRAERELARDQVATTGTPAAIRLKTDRPSILADREDVSVVEVEIVDSKGRVVPTGSSSVSFAVEGPGQVVGVGNGDPSSHEPDKAKRRSAFNGRCMALIGASHKAGKIVVRASSPGFRSATLVLTSR